MMNLQREPQQQLIDMNQNLMSMNHMNMPQQQQPQPQMVPMNMSYGMWAPPLHFQKPNTKLGGMKPPASVFNKALGPRNNWKGKKVNKPIDKRRKEQQKSVMVGSGPGGIGASVGNINFNNYQPPTLNELQYQNRLKTRKFYPKKKFNKNKNMSGSADNNYNNNYYYNNRFAPFAPRNTTSFIIRAKKSGGIASLVSPCPVTPAVLPTPIFSPSREVLMDMAKEEWGVDGYGTMKGLIRLRSPGHEMEPHVHEEEDEGGSSESDVEEHVEVERRLNYDLSRFEMIYDPKNVNVGEYHSVLENRVDDQNTHIAQLEEENLTLKERLFLMETELGDLRRRMQSLERRGNSGQEIIDEVLENDSENDSEYCGEEARSVEDINEDQNEDNNVQGDSKHGVDDGTKGEVSEAVTTLEKSLEPNVKIDKIFEATENRNAGDFESKDENNNQGFNEADKAEEISGLIEVWDDSNRTNDKDVKVNADDNVGVALSEMDADVCMKLVEPAETEIALDKDTAS